MHMQTKVRTTRTDASTKASDNSLAALKPVNPHTVTKARHLDMEIPLGMNPQSAKVDSLGFRGVSHRPTMARRAAGYSRSRRTIFLLAYLVRATYQRVSWTSHVRFSPWNIGLIFRLGVIHALISYGGFPARYPLHEYNVQSVL